MHHSVAEVLRAEHRIEDVKLVMGGYFVRVGGGEVGVDPGEPFPEDLASLPRLVRLDAPAVHAGVDLEVCLEAGMRHDALRTQDRVGRNLETVLSGEGKTVWEKVGEDEDRGADAGVSELGALLDRYDGQRIRAGFEDGARHGDGAVAVSICLYDGHEAGAPGAAFKDADVMSDRPEVHLGPGATWEFQGGV